MTAHDASGRIVPGAAESWSVSEDGLTWTFRLREDARWSDGVPVTAADFVFSFRRLLDPATAASLAYFLYAIDGAAAVNAGKAPVDELGVRADHIHLSPLLSIMYLVFNVTEPPFDDPRVRRALALAIDREILTGRVLESGEVPSASFVPPMVANYRSEVAPRAMDPKPARRLLVEAGYGTDNPLQVTLRYIAGDDSNKVQVAIAAMWKAIGVETALHHAELNAHFAELRQGNFQVAQAGWFGENNPEHYLELLMSATGDVNYGRFANAEVDALMAEAKRTAGLDERLRLLRRAEIAALDLDPVVPLYAVTIRSLVNPRITGWRTNARNVHPARYLGIRGN